jgi:DNA-binding transcriptional LysR family regulator
MELRHIRYFLAILEERSFTRAAKRCGVAQPSLTNAIHRLEGEVGGKLLVRPFGTQRETLPTDLALVMRPRLELALASVQLAQQAAADFLRVQSEDAKPRNGTAVIGDASDELLAQACAALDTRAAGGSGA